MHKPNDAFNFTKAALRTLACPEGKTRVYYRDTQVQGLRIRVTSSGVRTFVWTGKARGTVVHKTIGRFPEWSIKEARTEAMDITRKRNRGESLGGDGGVGENATFGQVWEHFLENHAKTRKRSWKDDEYRWEKHLKRWQNRKLSDIDRATVQAWHNRIGKTSGKYEANRVLALLRKMVNYARDIMGWQGTNPAERVKQFHEQTRERFLDAKELKRFLHALENYPDPLFRDLFALLLWTGQRKSNVCAMRWDEIDLDAALWTIPHDKTKTDRDYQVPLADEAAAILKQRRDRCEEKAVEGERVSEYVFPSPRKRDHHVTELRYAWAELLKRGKITNLRVHDLRRTFGSWQAAAGASLQIIGRSLGHQSLQATQIYSRLTLDPVRTAVETAVAAMRATTDAEDDSPEDAESAKIVDVRPAASGD